MVKPISPIDVATLGQNEKRLALEQQQLNQQGQASRANTDALNRQTAVSERNSLINAAMEQQKVDAQVGKADEERRNQLALGMAAKQGPDAVIKVLESQGKVKEASELRTAAVNNAKALVGLGADTANKNAGANTYYAQLKQNDPEGAEAFADRYEQTSGFRPDGKEATTAFWSIEASRAGQLTPEQKGQQAAVTDIAKQKAINATAAGAPGSDQEAAQSIQKRGQNMLELPKTLAGPTEKDMEKIFTKAQGAEARIANYDAALALNEKGKFGPGSDFKAFTQSAAQAVVGAFGGNTELIASDFKDAKAILEFVSSDMWIAARQQMQGQGQITDKESAKVEYQAIKNMNSKEANRYLLKVAKITAQTDVARAKFMTKFMKENRNMTSVEAEAAFAQSDEAKALWTERQAITDELVGRRAVSDEEAAKLPKDENGDGRWEVPMLVKSAGKTYMTTITRSDDGKLYAYHDKNSPLESEGE
jgi:hypothetical protein